MKFVAVLMVAVWLSLYAQADSVFYIEIAGDKDPAEQAKPGDSTLQPRLELEQDDTVSCRSTRPPGQKPLKGGMYLCSHVNTKDEQKRMNCAEPGDKAKSEINYNANFFVVSKAQIYKGYTLFIEDEQLKTLPEVMMVGFSVTGEVDSPMFVSHKDCSHKQEILHAEVFRNFLPSDPNKQEQLTNFFCCTTPHSCLFFNPAYVIDNYFPVIQDILQKCIDEDGKPPTSKKELERSKTNKGGQSISAAPKKSTLAKSKAVVTNLFGNWNIKKTLRPLGSMRGFTKLSSVMSRQSSGSSYSSGSDAENGRTSPRKSVSTSPSRYNSNSRSPSRYNSNSRSPSPDRRLNVEGDDPSKINLMEQYVEAESDLDGVMKIMLNRLIDPCVLMKELDVPEDKERKNVLQNTCQTYCKFLGVAKNRLTTRSSFKLMIDLVRKKSMVTCKKFNYGECIKSQNGENYFCKCFEKNKKGQLDSGRRMVLCDNHLRNYLTPISMCK